MNQDQIATVRRFTRLVTQRAGALEDHTLGRARPLGESRLLVEIGREGATLRDLRAVLGMDSGYLSRLVQNLVAEDLARLERSSEDRRVRCARLTPSGLAELEEINRRSDGAAVTILAGLSQPHEARLVAAMTEVDRLLKLARVEFKTVLPATSLARWSLTQYFDELGGLFEGGFDPSQSVVSDPSEFNPPDGAFLVVMVDGRSVGCGGVNRVSPPGSGDLATGYIKRMWIDKSMRGLGLSRQLLAALEDAAVDLGCSVVQLETNRWLPQALQLYRTSGYDEVEPFNDEVYAHYWFRKHL